MLQQILRKKTGQQLLAYPVHVGSSSRVALLSVEALYHCKMMPDAPSDPESPHLLESSLLSD